MTCFGINTACVCYADRKIDVAHNLGEYDIGDIRDLDFFARLAIGEAYPFKCGRFNIGRREPIGKRIDLRYEILFVIYLLQTVFNISYPTAALKRTDRFGRLYLIAGLSEGVEHIHFLCGFHVQLTEYLTERL